MLEPGKKLEPGDVERLMSAELSAGLEHVWGADNIASERDRNYDYYRGIMRDLPAPDGRSRVVEPTIANYIGLLKPSLMRIFGSGRNVAEYVSPKPQLEATTRLVTRYVNDVVFRKDNRGMAILLDWADDALIQKLGIAMYWWEDNVESKDEVLEGIPDATLPALLQQIQAKGAEVVEHTPQEVMAQTPQGAVPSVVHSLKVRTKVNKSKCCIDVVPPEEFVISRDARTLEDAVLRAHRTGVRVGDLIRAGYPAEEVDDLPEYVELSPYTATKYGRNVTGKTNSSTVDPMLKKVAITRGILKCDYDGTGIKDWYVVAGGDEGSQKLLEIQPYNDQIGFADFCPEPMPHTVWGRCPADRLAGLQKIQTVLLRQANDNLFLSNTPQREVVMANLVKPDQLQNMNPGAPIMVTAPNSIREISIPFVADKALAMIQYYDSQAELTTGVGRMTAGLDPDTLTNQSATASNNMVSAQQSRAELIARTWAQGGMYKLFRGVFRCLRAYQDFSRVVLIDGNPQTIDPQSWEALDDLDVNINTGLGTGSREKDFALLTAMVADQKESLEKLGPTPMVDFQTLARTQQLRLQAAGVSYPEQIWGDAKTPDGKVWVPPPPPQPQPSPDTIVMAKVEAAKLAQKAKADADDNQLKRETEIATITSNERIAYRKQDMDAAVATKQIHIKSVELAVRAAEVDAEQVRTDMMKGKTAA